MKWLIIAAASLAVLYILFILIPSVLVFRHIVKRKELSEILSRDLSGTYYDPYLPALREASLHVSEAETERLSMQMPDGTVQEALYLDCGSRKTAVLFHGYNATPEKNCALYAEFFLREGYNVCLPCMRAHGNGGGKYSTFGILEKEDVKCWLRKIAENPEIMEITALGVSMGASALAYASPDLPEIGKLKILILDCGFCSPHALFKKDMKEKYLPVHLMLPLTELLARLFLKVDFREDTAAALSKASVPTLFITGDCDTTVPMEQVLQNYEACSAPKGLYIAKGAEHALSIAHDPEGVSDAVRTFIQKYGGEKPLLEREEI